ncbi:BspA family leucine-rich repeat surface protein [Carnobacterium maltaromaticum]|uniref:BspA family leucine-rich repeat surface protein n=1 Tax=Carnobacterium maltaromaticum TaxID=2751 RepID=UPI00295EA7E6|nr:BspA family leucine-rich repeat surface protein [Carnobacterium maltaromaticum]
MKLKFILISLLSIGVVFLNPKVEATEISSVPVLQENPNPKMNLRNVIQGVWGTSNWTFDEALGVVTIDAGKLGDPETSPWNSGNGLSPDMVKTIIFTGIVEAPVKSSRLFSGKAGTLVGLNNLVTITNLDYLLTKNVTQMNGMFEGASSLTNLDLNFFDTSQVVNMESIFSGMTKLLTLNIDLWDTSSVTNFGYVFSKTHSLSNLNISEWDTGSAEKMPLMFYEAQSLTELNISKWNVKSVNQMEYMFSGMTNLSQLDIGEWDVSSVKTMRGMFYGASSLKRLHLNDWDTQQTTDMSEMFGRASSLADLDVSNWDTSSVLTMQSMFSGTKKLLAPDIGQWNVSKVKSMYTMFNGAGLESLAVNNWDTGSVESMNNMFSSASNLSQLEISNWDTHSVTDMGGMFAIASNIEKLDISQWDTSAVTRMDSMFQRLGKITTINLSDWDTGSVQNFSYMFSGTVKLIDIDVSGFDTGVAKNMDSMFKGASSLESLDLSSFKFAQLGEEGLNNFLSSTGKLSKLTLGSSFFEAILAGEPNLPAIKKTDDYSGQWVGVSPTNEGVVFATSDALMFDFRSDHAGTFVWQANQESLVVKSTTIEKGSVWTPEDNFISATNFSGGNVSFPEITVMGSVDTSKAGEYQVTYTNNIKMETVTVTVIAVDSIITIEFLNEDAESISEPVILNKRIGETVNLTEEEAVTNILNRLVSEGYDIQTRPENETSLDIIDEEYAIIYTFLGKLSFVSAPTTIDFGTLPVRTSVQRINQPTNIDGQLTVRDSRAVKGNWELSAKLSTPLSNGSKTVTDALRYVYNDNELVLSQDAQIVAGQRNLTNDIFSVSDTWSADGDGIKLQTAVGSVLEKGDYRAVITWELTEAP